MQLLSHIPWRHSNSSLVTPRESHHEPWGKSLSPEESQLILTFLRAVRLSPGLMRLSPGLMLECLLGYFTSVQHSSSLVSSIKKRIFVFFERVPLTQPGFESRTFRTVGKRLNKYSIEKDMKERVLKDNQYTQGSLRDRPRAQEHILSRLAFLKYFNYWKIAGLRPAIFSGTPRNFET